MCPKHGLALKYAREPLKRSMSCGECRFALTGWANGVSRFADCKFNKQAIREMSDAEHEVFRGALIELSEAKRGSRIANLNKE